jgi:hypothetical protein
VANLRLVHSQGEKHTFDSWSDEGPEAELPGPIKPILFGLPCARCRAYYDAELKACPICRSTERVSPTACKVVIPPKARAA